MAAIALYAWAFVMSAGGCVLDDETDESIALRELEMPPPPPPPSSDESGTFGGEESDDDVGGEGSDDDAGDEETSCGSGDSSGGVAPPSFGEGRYQYICRCFTVCWDSPQRVYFADEYLGVYDIKDGPLPTSLPCDGSDDGRSMEAEMICLAKTGKWPDVGNIAEPVTCTLLVDDLGIGD